MPKYGNTSEYLRELIRRDQEDEAKRRLRELITEGLESGPARALTPDVVADLKRKALDAALKALEPIRMPGLGSPRLRQLCEIAGLRTWRVAGFPMQWLYFEAADHLDVVRLPGDRQDIIAILADSP